MNKYENKENNCHYRDCEAITDNISRINLLSYPTSIGYLSRIKREFAEILGSCFASPRMTVSVLALAAVLSTSISSESWAATSGCNCGSGTDCCWKIESGVLTIYPNPERSSTGNVMMKNFGKTGPGKDEANGYTSTFSSTAPWARQGVTSVVVENGISNIGIHAFCGDTKITSVSGMENVTLIRNEAFFDATSLKSVDMPNVETIGDFAFNNARSLQSVDMPKVTSIANQAFKGATSLSYAGLNQDGSVSIAGSAFYDTNISGCSKSNSARCNYCTNSSTNTNISGDATIYQPSTTGNTGSCVATCAGGYTASNGLCKKNQAQSMPENCQTVENGACTTCTEGYLTNSESVCILATTCKDGLHIDGNACVANDDVNCNTEVGGKCTVCKSDYLTNSDGGCTLATDCKDGLHIDGNACVANDDVNCNTQEGNKCTECKGGYLEQSGACVTSCGAGYKQMENWCNRIQYTPAEAAAILNDDDNTITITFKK